MTKIKKALLSVLCCFALIFCSAFVFTACTRVQNIRYEINVVQVENGELKVFGEPYAGNEITIQVVPNAGYEIVAGSLKVNGEKISTNKFLMPSKNVEISAQFKKITYSVDMPSYENGKLDIEVDGQKISSGDKLEWGKTVTIEILPDSGYALKNINVLKNDQQLAVNGSGNIRTFVMPQGNVTINATFEKITYTLTKVSEHGTFTIPATANTGKTVQVAGITPATGYELEQILVDGVALGLGETSFTMPANNVTVEVTFKKINYIINKSETTNGSFTVQETATYGESVTISVTPATGYELDQILVDGEALGVGITSFTMPAKDVTVSVTFKQSIYTITREGTVEHGTFEVQETAIYGEEVEITSNPDISYKAIFTVMFNETPIAVVNNKFIMPAGNVTISATFAQNINSVIITATTNGTVSANPVNAVEGSEVELTITPNTGYKLETLVVMYGETPVTVADNKFVMPAGDVTVSATFVLEDYIVSKSTEENGTYSLSKTVANYNDLIEIILEPNTGYELDQILVNGVALEVGVTSFTMPANDVTVSVTFKKINYIITKSETTNGSFTVQETATYGENVTVSATPATGYELDQILVDGVALEVGITSFTMPAKDVTVSVTFKIINYTITKNETTNGSFTVQETATYGENVTVSVTPATGNELDQILVDGVALEVGITSFTMPAKDVTVSVTFKIINYTITKNETTNGSFTVQETATYGESVVVTGTPNTSYYFNDVLVEWEGGSLHAERTSETEFRFTMPSNNVTISCTFGETYVLGLYDVTYTTSGTDLTITKVTTSKTSYEIPATFMAGETTYNVVTIGDGTNCVDSDVESIILPEGLTVIKQKAFSGCTGLTSIIIPTTVTAINTWAFSSCSNLVSISLSEGLKTISGGAFENCTSLTTIIIPSTVTSVGEYAFNGCSKLEIVEFNSTTPPTVGNNVFYNCSKLTTITVPKGTKSAYVTALGDAYEDKIIEQLSLSDISYTTYGTDLTITGVTATETSYAIPSRFVIGKTTYTVKSLRGTASGGISAGIDTDVVKVILPSTLTSIGNNAFYNCRSLTSITIPTSVTGIENSALSSCTGLTSITIPNSVTWIGDSAFSGCTGLTSITIPESVTIIRDSAFNGCTGLTSITISNGVTYIGNQAFDGCTGLTSITIPNSVTRIGGSAFTDTYLYNNANDGDLIYVSRVDGKRWLLGYKTTKPTGTLIIPDDVIGIANSAFSGCTGLTSVEIPNSVTIIDGYAFENCTGLTSIEIPNSVTDIGNSAFNGCTSFTSITIPDSVEVIGNYVFYGCTGLDSITFEGVPEVMPFAIPTTVTTIYVPTGTKDIFIDYYLGSDFADKIVEQ
ncbi:MAG: leucine-rich repeat protein [Christensenellales bacterium]